MYLKEYCEQKNITLEKAAAEIGCSYEDIRRYANGKVIPRLERMKKIVQWSEGLIQPNDFYDFYDNDEKE